jgi:hypothetical protein
VAGETVGTVRERATWWNPVYHIFDNVGSQVVPRHHQPSTSLQVMKIRGPSHFSLCDDDLFHAVDTDGHEVATITRKRMGCLKETLTVTDADNFVIDYKEGLDMATKIFVFASTFLIDMMYFGIGN